MARVMVSGSVRVGSRRFDVKRVPNIAPILAKFSKTSPYVSRSTVEATAIQLRVIAQEIRELVLDRLFLAVPQRPGRAVVKRPRVLARDRMPTATRKAYPHKPLRRKTVMRKVRKREDGRKLIATGDYVRGIEVFKGQQSGGVGVYYMVRPADRKHKPSGIMLSKLARVHEFGSRKHRIPKRPHWGPAVRDVRAALPYYAKAIRAEALRRLLRKIG